MERKNQSHQIAREGCRELELMKDELRIDFVEIYSDFVGAGVDD